tara:strand:- start:544 stop:720 length:177 start_codon:yes stop_codon:yes gene_type:complete
LFFALLPVRQELSDCCENQLFTQFPPHSDRLRRTGLNVRYLGLELGDSFPNIAYPFAE